MVCKKTKFRHSCLQLFFNDVVDRVLSAEIDITLAFRPEAKTFAKQNYCNQTSNTLSVL